MWGVDKAVDYVENFFVDLICPQNLADTRGIWITRNPHRFLSIYRRLSRLLGYPRSYDYVEYYI